jgi:TRAP-type C4-dicarboxylate transport system substrate-binding protein
MSRVRPSLLVFVAVVLSGVYLAAAPVTVRLATIVPRNSVWYNALADMGATWTKSTESRVKLTIYEGGTQGDERTVIRLMRPEVDQLNAALLTSTGLGLIDDAFNVFGIPFFFQSDAEMRYVREKLTPLLSTRLEAKGIRLIHWGQAGWVQVFSKSPVKSLADLKKLKLFTSEGDDRTVQWYTQSGFRPVALKPNDIRTGLTTGLIDAAPSPAYAASVIQLHQSADYMLDIRVAPLIGATVVADRIWNQISADDRTKVLAAGQVMEHRLETDVPAQDAKAVDNMRVRNPKFTVVKLDAAAMTAFRTEAERLAATMRGAMVPADVYDLAVRERDAFRKTGGK